MDSTVEVQERISTLKVIVEDDNQPVAERRAALRLIAVARNEPDTNVGAIPESDLRTVARGMLVWENIGLKGLTLADSREAVASGRAARERRIKYGR